MKIPRYGISQVKLKRRTKPVQENISRPLAAVAKAGK